MVRAAPDSVAVAAALEAVATTRDFTARIDALTKHFLGRPYLAFPLRGGLDEPEELVTRLDGFECVTFVESVYALAASQHVAAFAGHLQRLRYLHGRLSWADRNHYMNVWIRRNIEAGFMEPLLAFAEVETGEVRELSALPGYPAQRWPVRYVPSGALNTLERYARPGDLVAFVSNRDDIDVFHVGVLIPGPVLRVRHAARSAGEVVEHDLATFLSKHDVPGMLLARPVAPGRSLAAARTPEINAVLEASVQPITVLLTAADDLEPTMARLAASNLVAAAVILVPPRAAQGRTEIAGVPCTEFETNEHGSHSVIETVLERTETPLLLVVSGAVDPHPTALCRMVAQVREAGAGMVFGDYMDLQDDGTLTGHPLSDYQPGSLQDTFPFGPLQLWNVHATRHVLAKHASQNHRFMAWYDLRLKIAETYSIIRLPEPLCTLRSTDRRKTGKQQFDYLTASRDAQIEAEEVCTQHLERIGARLAGPFSSCTPTGTFPVQASVVIPVRNRVRTILDAVNSALEQQTDFAFNVIVVDNHSTDGTTEALRARSAEDPRLVHVIPGRSDLGIGGCWNCAVNHELAGTYVVQLDSDDCYSSTETLARMVQILKDGQCGMAIGSYSLVNMALESIPPGLIDHREWTEHNGPNNALRIAGMGAPRAFATELVRQHPFPNASYGEDYAVALRISRNYRVGRIYDSVYLCRRWEDNSDADLAPDVKARFQTYKDRLRSLEVAARIAANRRSKTESGDGR